MTTSESNATLQNIKTTTNSTRPLANFPPSVWGDRFLSFSLDKSMFNEYAKAIEESKEEVRILIVNPAMDSNAKLSLINIVFHLGMKYLFIEEIDGQLEKLFKDFNMEDNDQDDLHTISTNFQVFRQHGYKISCDVFNKFKDHSSGKFMDYITTDVKGMLSFYEAAQLRIRGESILDEALSFTEARLNGVVDTLSEGNLARQVKHALRTPYHRGMPMGEARLYFANYEEECSKYDSLQNLGNAHLNYLQLLHKEELRVFAKWSKDMEFQVICHYARNRIPELYLWILSLFLEPQYSQARIIASKMINLISVLDDTYDAYGTIDELWLFTDAINRWEITAVEQLPEYIKPYYKILLNEHDQLSKLGRTCWVDAAKQAFQELARAYFQEALWRHSGQVPSFQEYIKNGSITCTYDAILKYATAGMGKLVSEESLAWYNSHPKFLQATRFIGRIINDVRSFEFESARGEVTGIDAYMKSYGVSQDVAVEKLKEMLEDSWLDINEGLFRPIPCSMELHSIIVNNARITDAVYRYVDEYTAPGTTYKDYITLLLV